MTSAPHPSVESDPELESQFELAFAPLHKRCLGLAVGAVVALAVALATALSLLRAPENPYPLELLGNFFLGYEVSWGALPVGAFWGFWLGFVVGWSFAFARNLVLAITSFVFRARAELEESRGFLDHI